MSQTATRPTDRRATRRWWLLGVVSLGQFMVLLDTTVVALALPKIQTTLDANAVQTEWVVNAYVLCFGGLMLLGGRLADRWGRRRVLIAGVVLFAAASGVCGAVDTPLALIAARAGQGVGAALLAPAALSTVTSSFAAGRERTTALGVFAALSGLGGTLGVVVGGVVTDVLSWRWIFYLNLPIGLLVVAGVLLFAPRAVARRGAGRPDVAGALLVTAGLTLLCWATVNITDDGWTGRWVVLPFALAVVLLAAFCVLELRVADPLVPLRGFAHRTMVAAATGRLMTAGVQASVLLLGSFYLQRSMEYSTLRAGLAFLPLGVVAIAVTVVLPRIMHRIGLWATYVAGAAGSLAALAWWAWAPGHDSYLGYVLPALIVLGVSMQACTVPVNVAGISEVPLAEHGVASAALTASFQIGTSLGIAVVAGPALRHTTTALRTGTAAPDAWSSGLRIGFAVAVVIAVLNLATAVLLVPRRAAADRTGTQRGSDDGTDRYRPATG